METAKQCAKILKVLLKEFTVKQTVTSLAKELGMSRVGSWKILKKMQSDKLIILSPIGTGKTSTYHVSLNWDNPLVEKTLALTLTEDALKKQRWISNFAELKEKIDFLIIYGSILHSPQEANDIDLLCIISNKNRFLETEEIIKKIQKTQLKKIHALSLAPTEFRQELEKPNKVFTDAVKKGIILFGQEKFIELMKKVILR